MIHETAIVSPKATIGSGVEIGAYSIIDDNVTIGDNTTIMHHCHITGWTSIGKNNIVHSFSAVGSVPQDLKFKGEKTFLEIGDGNTFREGTTVNVGTEHGGGLTKVGSGNLFMTGAHVGHDVRIGDKCIIANNVGLAGHVIIEDEVLIGGNSGVQQFVHIGTGAVLGGMSGLTCNLPPYSLAYGSRAVLHGINLVGLRRRKVSNADIYAISDFYKLFYEEGITPQQRSKILEQCDTNNPFLKTISHFLGQDQSKAIITADLS